MNGSEIKAKFQMIGNRIINLNIDNSFIYVDLEDDSIERSLDISYELSEPFYFEDGSLGGNVTMYIEVSLESEDCFMQVHLEIEGCFNIDEEGTEEELKEMLSVSGTAALYSIARGIISGVTSQTCTNGTLLLPMMNMFELRKKTETAGD